MKPKFTHNLKPRNVSKAKISKWVGKMNTKAARAEVKTNLAKAKYKQKMAEHEAKSIGTGPIAGHHQKVLDRMIKREQKRQAYADKRKLSNKEKLMQIQTEAQAKKYKAIGRAVGTAVSAVSAANVAKAGYESQATVAAAKAKESSNELYQKLLGDSSAEGQSSITGIQQGVY